MVEIKYIVPTDNFKHDVKKIRDKGLKQRLQEQIEKVAEDPNSGKPLRYNLKGEYSVRVKPYRMIYAVEGDKLILLRAILEREAVDPIQTLETIARKGKSVSKINPHAYEEELEERNA